MRKARCSFCGEESATGRTLIEGPPIRISCSCSKIGEKNAEQLGEIGITPFICSKCVDQCQKILSGSTETSGPKKIPEAEKPDG